MALWTPEYIDTALWLDASDSSTFTMDGSGNVEVLADKSGNGRHISQATPAHRFIPEAGALKSDGNRFMVADGLTGLGTMSNASLIAVGQHKTQVSTDYIATLNVSTNSNGRFFPGVWRDNTYEWRHDDVTYFASVPQDPTRRHIFAMIADAGAVTALHDGYIVGSKTTESTLALDQIGLGTYGPVPRLNGDFCEVIGIAAGASLDDRQKIEGYLAHKWGLTANLPADHPYKTAAPQELSISGTILGADGTPAARIVRAYNRSTGVLLGETISDAATGAYDLGFATNEEIQRVVIADETALYNDIIDRVIPG